MNSFTLCIIGFAIGFLTAVRALRLRLGKSPNYL